MRHDLIIPGHAFSLRPIALADAEFIIALRTQDQERVRYLHPIPADVDKQREWLVRYFQRDGDYYWVIERNATREPEGLIGIYDLVRGAVTAEWGRWVLKPKSLAATESAWLIYRAAFESLSLESLYCVTVSENTRVVSFHDSCGLPRQGILPGRFQLNEATYDGIVHRCHKSDWPPVSARLEAQAQLIARRLARTL